MACKGCSKKKAQRENILSNINKESVKTKEDKIRVREDIFRNIWKMERYIGSAIQQLYEVRCGYPHMSLAIGNITRAYELASNPELKEELKDIIVALRDGKNKNFENVLNFLSRRGNKNNILMARSKIDSEVTIDRPQEKLITRPSCLECVEKHLGSAMALLDKNMEYNEPPYYRLILAVGHLAEAEQESQEYPDLEDLIYIVREQLQTNKSLTVEMPISISTVLDVLKKMREEE